MIPVIVNRASGRMGQETVKAIDKSKTFALTASLGRHDNLAEVIANTRPKVVVDFTAPDCVFDNSRIIIDGNIHPVIGTTGLTPEQIDHLQNRCAEKKLGGIIAPNFSLGAILMMRFAAEASKYMQDAEIIEMHHPHKKDAPSGTAIKTAEMIRAARGHRNDKAATISPQQPIDYHELIPHARGAKLDSIQIHSMRLPGLVANQQVILGGLGETLTISHQTINRECFMPGVILACEAVTKLDSLVYGLDQIL